MMPALKRRPPRSRASTGSYSIAVVQRKRLPNPARPAASEMREKGSNMLAPAPILHDPPELLGDLRLALSLRPQLADYPRRRATYLEAGEQDAPAWLAAIPDERGRGPARTRP